ncbi:MAG: MBL fold metallo-hydrolase [Myxococcota bacterium]|nr:MBL fold metallo-hydrolase [Myxococcota bacterium]
MKACHFWGALLLTIISVGCEKTPCVCEEFRAPQKTESSKKVELPPGKTSVVMLGSGTPVLAPENSGPAVVVVAGGKSYLVDFGPGVVRRAEAAYRMGMEAVNPRRITHAFATHLHSDHTLGYADLMLTPPVVGRDWPLHVYGPPGIKAMTEHIMAAYTEDLNIRKSRKGITEFSGYETKPVEFKPGVIYEDANVRVTAFAVAHGKWEHAYGFKFETKDRTIVISGDTTPTNRVAETCDGCDVLVHEVYCYEGWKNGPKDWRHYHKHYHTSGPELAQLARKARPKLLLLYHKLFFGCTEEQLLEEVTRRYDGDVKLAEDLGVY